MIPESLERVLNQLHLYRYRVNIRIREEMLLPQYKGSAFRGVFGHALRRVVCPFKEKECQECMLRLKCIFSAVMGAPVDEGHPHYRKFSSPHRPYLIVPPITTKRLFEGGERLFFEVVLVGSVNDYLPYFVFAFEEMGRRGMGLRRARFEVVSVDAVDACLRRRRIYAGAEGVLRGGGPRIAYRQFRGQRWGEKGLKVTFETPTRIKWRGRLLSHIPFGVLVERLAERACMLAHFYCGAELAELKEVQPLEGVKAIKAVTEDLKWLDWRRYSSRHGEMTLGGVVGTVIYRGDFHGYLPLLKVGEHIHVGKAVTFGLGKLKVEASDV